MSCLGLETQSYGVGLELGLAFLDMELAFGLIILGLIQVGLDLGSALAAWTWDLS